MLICSERRRFEVAEDKLNREHDELLMRTTSINHDIKLVKTQQWQATYYSLLLSAGIIALLNLEPVMGSAVLRTAAVCVSIFQMGAVLFFHITFAFALGRYRKSANAIDAMLKTDIKAMIDARVAPRVECIEQLERYIYAALFIILGLLGPTACLFFFSAT